MLSKKMVIQKSFRIDANMENDLEMLAQKLNRAQNELVNAALNQLMIDNMGWFVEDFLLDLCKKFLDKSLSEIEIKITGLRIHLHDNGKKIIFDYDIETTSYTEHCDSGAMINNSTGYEILCDMLKEIALKIGSNAPEIQGYLHNRFEYIFARESIIQKFDRNKFICQSIGFEPSDN